MCVEIVLIPYREKRKEIEKTCGNTGLFLFGEGEMREWGRNEVFKLCILHGEFDREAAILRGKKTRIFERDFFSRAQSQ